MAWEGTDPNSILSSRTVAREDKVPGGWAVGCTSAAFNCAASPGFESSGSLGGESNANQRIRRFFLQRHSCTRINLWER